MYSGAKQSLVSSLGTRDKGQGGRAGQAVGMNILGYSVFLNLPLPRSELELETERGWACHQQSQGTLAWAVEGLMPSRAWPWSGMCSCVALAHLLASQCPEHGHMPGLWGEETKLKHIVHYARVSGRGFCIRSISLTRELRNENIRPCPRPIVSEMWRWETVICIGSL